MRATHTLTLSTNFEQVLVSPAIVSSLSLYPWKNCKI